LRSNIVCVCGSWACPACAGSFGCFCGGRPLSVSDGFWVGRVGCRRVGLWPSPAVRFFGGLGQCPPVWVSTLLPTAASFSVARSGSCSRITAGWVPSHLVGGSPALPRSGTSLAGIGRWWGWRSSSRDPSLFRRACWGERPILFSAGPRTGDDGERTPESSLSAARLVAEVLVRYLLWPRRVWRWFNALFSGAVVAVLGFVFPGSVFPFGFYHYYARSGCLVPVSCLVPGLWGGGFCSVAALVLWRVARLRACQRALAGFLFLLVCFEEQGRLVSALGCRARFSRSGLLFGCV